MGRVWIHAIVICFWVLTVRGEVTEGGGEEEDLVDLNKLSDDELWDFLTNKESKDNEGEEDYDGFKKLFGEDALDVPSSSERARPVTAEAPEKNDEGSTRTKTVGLAGTQIGSTPSKPHYSLTKQNFTAQFDMLTLQSQTSTLSHQNSSSAPTTSSATSTIKRLPIPTVKSSAVPRISATLAIPRTSMTPKIQTSAMSLLPSKWPSPGTNQSAVTLPTTTTLPTTRTLSSRTTLPATTTQPSTTIPTTTILPTTTTTLSTKFVTATSTWPTTTTTTTRNSATFPKIGTTYHTSMKPRTRGHAIQTSTIARKSPSRKMTTTSKSHPTKSTKMNTVGPKLSTSVPSTTVSVKKTAATKSRYTRTKLRLTTSKPRTTQLKVRPSLTLGPKQKIVETVKSTTATPKTVARNGFMLLKNRLFTLPPESFTTEFAGPTMKRTTTTSKPVTLDQTLVQIDNRKKLGKTFDYDPPPPHFNQPICFTFTNNSNPLQTWTECFIPPPNFLFVPLVDEHPGARQPTGFSAQRKFAIPDEFDRSPLEFPSRLGLNFQRVSDDGSTPPPRRKFEIFDSTESKRWPRLRLKREATVVDDDAEDEDAPGVSLAFVFDTTGSMSSELESVKDNAVLIMNEMLKNPNSAIYNFIFVPIHDDETPDPPTVTRNRLVMSEAINRISVSGGLDCPEKSLEGLMKAVELSRDKSYIYVFTDAEPKDYGLMNSILDLNSKKQHTISFLLTGSCFRGVTPEQQETFATIASASTGYLLLNSKGDSSEMDKLLVWIRNTLRKNKVVLTAINSPGSARPYMVNFPVEPHAKELTITATGTGTKVEVKDPTGKVPGPGEIYKTIDINSISSWNVPSPMPGVWTLDVSNKNKHSVLVSAESTTDFIYGFSLQPTAYIAETSKIPKISATNYVLVQAKDTSNLHNVTEIILLHINGSELWHQPVSAVDIKEGTYRTEGFVPPNERFKMMIIGHSKDGYDIRRVTISSVAPRLPDVPYIKIRKEIHATAGVPFNLTCAVDSLVPVIVRIYKEGDKKGLQKTFERSIEASYHIPSLQKSDEGKYTCSAQNVAGTSVGVTFLRVIVPPPVTSVTSEIVGLPGDRQSIVCRIKSLTDYTVKWTKALKSSDNINYYAIGDEIRGRLTREGSELVIDPLTLADEGWYMCAARNDGGEHRSTTLLIVRERPSMKVDADQYFQRGDTIIIQCEAIHGIPTPDAVWFKNERELQNTGNVEIFKRQGFARLKITRAQRKDEGRYECVGQNIVGKDKKQTNLLYSEAPLVGATEDHLEIVTGSILVLQCTVSGVPFPEIKWTKKRTDGDDDEDVYSERTDGILRIENVTIEDSGLYRCSAVNVAGESDAVISVLVGSSPVIISPPRDTAVQIDTDVKLFCSADGVPQPDIVWRRKDRRGGGRYTRDKNFLEIKNVTISDAGIYICYAQNIFGRVHAEAQVTVVGTIPPRIEKTEEVDIVKTLTGNPVELRCPVAEGNPAPQITWHKNKKLLDLAYFKGYLAENGSLIISAVTIRHVGNYTCQASSPVGVDRKDVELRIYSPPVVDFTVSPNIVVSQSQNATLPCKVTGDPEPTVTWRKDGPKSDSPFRGIQQKETNFLFIENVKTEDSGRYVCFASNIAGVSRREFTLQVIVPPKITKWPEITHTELGNIVSLHCNASGEPRPTITWFKDNQVYQRARYIQGPYLRFFAESADAGVYSCLAENKAGGDRVDTKIIVLERPKIKELPKEIEVIKGKTAHLFCYASGNPDPSVSWLHNGEVVMKTVGRNDTTVLKLENVLEKDAGSYACVAVNSVGTDRRKVELTVLEPPQINTKNDVLKVAPGELAQLNCEVTANPRPLIVWHKDGDPFRDAFGSSDGLLQFVASSNHTGDFTCTATNKAGTDTKTFHVIVLESPKFASGLPQSVDVIAGENVDLPCIAFGDPKPEITWDQFNFPILPNNVQFFPNGSLRIVNASIMDEGVYTCNAKNKAGLSKHFTTLNVLEFPKIQLNVKHPKNGVVNEGEEVVIICNVKGKPLPAISWWKDGARYTAAQSDNFNVLRFKAKRGDSGNYTCSASNSIGKDKITRAIYVMFPPKIYQSESVSMVALRGQVVTMSCEADGHPLPFITWYSRGMKINPSPFFEVSENKLTIKNITVDLSGAYLCRAVNAFGTDEKTFNMSVHVKPEIVDEFPTNLTVVEGEDFSLPCKAEGIPPPEVLWQVGPQILPIKFSNEKLLVYHDGTLILSNAKAEAAGEYECVASNVEGNATKLYNVVVTVTPKLEELVRGSKLVEAREGGVAQLKCPAEKGVAVIWLKDGKPIKSLALERADDAHYYEKDGGRILKINDASENDIASYTCLVQGPAGNLTTDFVVNVLIKPYFVDFIPPSDYEVVEGDSLEVDCSAKGNPPPMVKWIFYDSYFGPVPVTHHTIPGMLVSSDSDKLIVPSATHNNTGNFSCQAVNRFGRSPSHKFTIRVVGRPKVLGRRLEWVNVPVNNSIQLHCNIFGVPSPKFSWIFKANEKEEHVLEGKNSTDFDVLRAGVADSGNYTCRAENSLGFAEQSFMVNVISVPIIQKPSILLQLSDYIEMSCAVNNSLVEASWVKNGYPLVKSWNVQTSSLNHWEKGTVQHFLRINSPTKDDSGHYSCIFSNIAGSSEDSFDVVVAVPPESLENATVEFDQELGKSLTVTCPMLSETESVVAWYRGDDILYRAGVAPYEEPTMDIPEVTLGSDGEYRCQMENAAGRLSAPFKINVLVPPRILSNASSKVQVVQANSNVSISCPVYGLPEPSILWTKDFEPVKDENIEVHDNFRRLEITRVEIRQRGVYSCFARNKGGLAEKHFEVVVLDEGRIVKPAEDTIVYADLGETLELNCPLRERENKTSWFKANTQIQVSNLLSANTNWTASSWDLFVKPNVTDDDGGVYYCKVERYGKSEIHQFHVTVLVKRSWGPWSDWGECSKPCGTGLRNRTRQCGTIEKSVETSPNEFLQFDDAQCTGVAEDFSICNVNLCPIDGGWSQWTAWEPCSAVCGQGVRRRHRNCDNPAPAYGGRDCEGASDEEVDCQVNPCPIHGNWSVWSEWNKCSTTCGFGVKLRTRRCDNPPPEFGGYACQGSSREIAKCDSPPCPDKRGKWTKWSEWTECSTTCGKGFKRRTRTCLTGGCQGTNTQLKPCKIQACPKRHRRIPRMAELSVNGEINGVQFNHSKYLAYVQNERDKTAVLMNSPNPIPSESNAWFPYQEFLVPAVTWTSAREIENAKNGYSMSQGEFKLQANYQFSTGQRLNIESDGLGTDENQILKISVNARGQTPLIRPESVIKISPYSEKIVQSNDGTLRSESRTTLNVDGLPLDVLWNKTYALKTVPERMTYPVEELESNEIRAAFDKSNSIVRYKARSSIKKKGNTCPPGFAYNREYQHCTDINECAYETICPSDEVCVNSLGSFTCSCKQGFTRGVNKTCMRSSSWKDESILADEESPCGRGLKLVGGICEDVNECLEPPSACSKEEVCLNVYSSHLCTPIPCEDGALINLNDSSCVLYCNRDRECLEGAALTEAFSILPVALSEFNVTLEPYEEIAQMTLTFFNENESLRTVVTVSPENQDLRLRVKLVDNKIRLYTLEHLQIVDLERVNVHASLRNEQVLLKTHQFVVLIYNMNNLSEL